MNDFHNKLDPESDGEAVEPRIKLIPFNSITLGTEPRYLVHGLVPLVGVTLVWGAPKSGKSYWTFDMVMHVALGRPYRGRRVQQGAVVYCAFEGQGGMRQRVEAFRQRYLAKQQKAVPFYLQALRLDLVADHAELADQIDRTKPLACIVLDTLNRSLRGSENRDEDMSAYVDAAEALRERFNCAVIIVHHCGVETSRPRGHTSLLGAVAAELSVKRDAAKNIIVTVETVRDGDADAVIASRLEPLTVGKDRDGEPIIACVVEAVEIEHHETKQHSPKLSDKQRLALDALISLAASDGDKLPASFRLPNSLRAVSVTAWRAELFARGIIDKDGSNPRRAFADISNALKRKMLAGERNGLIWPIL